MKKALLLREARASGFRDAEGALGEALAGLFEIEVAADAGAITAQTLDGYAAVILMLDTALWEPDAQAARELVLYVTRGGNLLAIHNGLACRASELQMVFGARFVRYGVYGCVRCEEVSGGGTEISLIDEPMRFEIDPLAQITPLLYYAGTRSPAAWRRSWAKGKAACVAPGRSAASVARLEGLIRGLGEWFERAEA